MKVKELRRYLMEVNHDGISPDAPILVAFKNRDGTTTLSEITSVCYNGDAIQLNEKEFHNALGQGEKPYDIEESLEE